jgi:hypothetical protein
MEPAKFAKAIVGGAVAALAALVPLAGDGVSLKDALITAVAALAGFQAVYWTKNAE